MADTNATTTRSITVDLPDFPAGSVVFTLVTQFAAEGTEGFPLKEYTLTLDASGTGTQVLPVPSTDAWSWRIKTPDSYVYQATLGAGSALALTAWLAAEATTVTAATLSSLYLPLAGGTMTGALNFSGATNAGITPASKTTAERDALVSPGTGTVIWNTDTEELEQYDGTNWHPLESGSLVDQVRNDSGAALTVGTPVYITGYNVGLDLVTVDAADASSSATMPCVGIIQTASIGNNESGLMVAIGRVENMNTAAFNVGDVLYVSETTGTLTATAPTGTAVVQPVAIVLRSHLSLGIINVAGTGASGDFLPVSGGTISGTLAMADNLITRPVIEDYGETLNAIGSIGGGTQDIDLTLGNVVSGTVDTSTTTFTFSNPPASGTAGSFTLFLTNGGSQTVNWPASVDWAGGTAPTLTAAGVDILTFTTIDGGTIWYGFAAGLDMQ